MSPKSKTNALELLDKLEPSWTAPEPPPPPGRSEGPGEGTGEGTVAVAAPGIDLMEQALLCILTRRLTQPQAEATVRAMWARYGDWNEPRVSQIQELAEQVKSRSRSLQLQVAADVKQFLQEIF